MQTHDFGEELPAWWDQAVALSPTPEASLQASWWADLKTSFGWKVRRFAVTEKDNPIVMAQVLERPLPAGQRFWYSPRGPIWPGGDESKAAFTLLVDKIKTEAGMRGVLFWRIDPAISETSLNLKEFGINRSSEQLQPDHTLVVDLTESEEEIQGQMKPKGRYNISLAQRNGVIVRASTDDKDLRAFHRLEKITAKRDKIVIHNLAYFQRMLKLLVDRNQGELLLAEYNGKILSAALVEYFGQGATYLHGASSNENRNLMGNYLLQWEGMRRAKERGMKWYDLRGLAPENEPNHPYASLRQFKTRFGGRELHYIGGHDMVISHLKYGMFVIAERMRTNVLRRTTVLRRGR